MRAWLSAVLVAGVAAAACQKPAPAAPATPQPPVAPIPAPTPTPTPTPAPTPTPIPFHSIRVAFFGITCGGDKGPNNTARRLPVGCKGAVTATPKFADGSDVPPSVHGPDIRWDLVHGELMVRVADVPGQPFNKDLFGRRPGPFQLCAIVRDVTGCLDGEVVP